MSIDQFHGGVLRGDVFVSSDELAERSARAAAGLAHLGVNTGDALALLMRNDHPFFEASFAAAAVGAAPVAVNWHGRPDELRYVIADCEARVVVGHADLLRPVLGHLPDGLTVIGVETPPDVAAIYGVDPAEAQVPDDLLEWSAWLAGFAPLPPSHRTPLTTIYTSGTTGAPKGVRRLAPPGTPDDVAALTAASAEALGLTPGGRTVVTGPLYHTAPNSYGLRAASSGGFVALQSRFDPEGLLALIDRHRLEAMHMVPTMFVRLLRLDDEVKARYDLSSLRHVVHAAAPCPPEVKRAMIDWWGPIIHEYYGGTETGMVVTCTSEEWLAHPGTVGRPVSTAVVRIYDEAGQILPAGETGEIYMRASGFPDFTYIGRPEARAEVERDGLITCGDVGYLDDEGFLYLLDRKRDLVISGGVNIYPAEIETCLMGMPGIADCAVFGIPDDEYGEALAAAVQPTPEADLTPAAIQAYVCRHLSGYKAPKVIEFHPELPREDSGKIFKRKLRAPYWERAGRSI